MTKVLTLFLNPLNHTGSIYTIAVTGAYLRVAY